MKFIKKYKSAFYLTIFAFIVCGIIYPLFMTGIAQLIFPKQANGSLIKVDNEVVGSELIGQDFTDPKLFHSRPSAVNYNVYEDGDKYDGLASGSKNLAVSNPNLKKRINEDIDKFIKENPAVSKEDIPEDIISQSGSGLDPHISVKAAQLQVDRVAKNTNLSKENLEQLIKQNTSEKALGIFGEQTVNVLKLNIDLVSEMKK